MYQRIQTSKYNRKTQSGFTLLEMFIAIFIFSVTVVGFLLLTTRTIQRTRVASQQVIAQLLAQEGIELIQARRDANFITASQSLWDDEIYSACGGASGCIAHPFGGIDQFRNVGRVTPRVCAGVCPPLRMNVDGLYNYAEGNETIYTRTITAEKYDIVVGGDGEAMLITSRVEWQAGNIIRSIEIKKSITNWHIQNT
ncbi:MAG: prepilin-type N-terminal cleavage/methylation domain-containing protein [Planctomycetota bacterium]|jgi:prepilin-type N-terminal cleavage/methylation domain-containing protein